MKTLNLLLVLISSLLYGCAQKASTDHEDYNEEVAIQEPSPISTGVEFNNTLDWTNDLNPKDSNWIELLRNDFDPASLDSTFFIWKRISYEDLISAKSEFNQIKNTLDSVANTLVNPETQIQFVKGGEHPEGGYTPSKLYITEYLNCDELINSIEWVKWSDKDQKIDFTNWTKPYEGMMTYKSKHPCLEDSLTWIISPSWDYFDDYWDDFKNRQIPTKINITADTIFPTKKYSIILDWTTIHNYLINSELKLTNVYKVNDEKVKTYRIKFYEMKSISGYEKLAKRMSWKYNALDRFLKEEKARPACACANVLASPNDYPREEKIKCLRKYKCWHNANIDCMMGTESVWHECVP